MATVVVVVGVEKEGVDEKKNAADDGAVRRRRFFRFSSSL